MRVPQSWAVSNSPKQIDWSKPENFGPYMKGICFVSLWQAFNEAQQERRAKLAEAVFLSEVAKENVIFEPGETQRINRQRLALLLHRLPAEIDTMSLADYQDMLGVLDGDQDVRDFRKK